MADQTLELIYRRAIVPALRLLPVQMTSPQALVALLAITLQEARGVHRVQVVDGGGEGPARGLWQFERGGGVKGVLTHPVSRGYAAQVCEARDVMANTLAVWDRLAHDDILAAAFARLLLLTDAKSLPATTDALGMWTYYLRNWRPGQPHVGTWAEFHERARVFVAEIAS